MPKFRETLASGKFIVTAELEPPKGVKTDSFLAAADLLKDRVDGLNVPDNRCACIALGSLPASILVKERGGEPICTLTCRDRNRTALSANLLGAYALGIENVLLVSGDYFTFGDAVQSKPVFDLDSVQALQMARRMEQGRDIGGNLLDGAPSFCLGAVANPQADPLEPHFNKYLKKVRAGADFIQTLDVYDLPRLETFLAQARKENVKIIVGVRVVGKREAEMQRQGKMPGNRIPETWVEEILAAEEKRALEIGKQRAVEIISAVKGSGIAAGLHLTADHHAEAVLDVMTAAGL